MRVLTVQQPWAWAIVHGGKDIENRTQLWKYRGPLAIHAGARLSDRGVNDDRIGKALRDTGHILPDTIRYSVLQRRAASFFGAQLYTRAILGVVDLVDTHRDDGCCRPWGESDYARSDAPFVIHLVMENPRPFVHPIPAKGRLGLWKPDGELLAAIVGAIPHAA